MSNSQNLPRIKVSQNGRFLATEQDRPFFWLGDTAWELFHRLTREEAEEYFSNRAGKRFNVIQAVALAEVDGLNTPNRYDERPLVDNDPDKPNEAYFQLVDEFIQMAAGHGLYIGLLPTWGDKVAHMWGAGPIVFTPQKAYRYGLWLGKRYSQQTNIIWILGGDRPAFYQDPQGEARDDREVWREMARGVREGVGEQPMLMTYHPAGGHSTSEWIHDEAWLDMNMMQSGHGGGHDVPVWDWIAHDYNLTPVKPTIDGEPNYEDHPVSPWPTWDPARGYFRDNDVRKQCYRSVFAGGCGVTYGHQSIWQFYETWRSPITFPERDWHDALNRPGGGQLQYLRNLMESRPYFSRIPDQEMLLSDPGEGGEHVQATRDAGGSYAFVYLPTSKPVRVNTECLSGPHIKAQWYDPRTGLWRVTAKSQAVGQNEYIPPEDDGPDWVLVLDSIP